MSPFGTDGPECGGKLSSAELQVVQRSEQGIRPCEVRKQDKFSAGSRVMFTPSCPAIRFSPPSLLTSHHCCGAAFTRPSGPELCGEDNNGFPCRKRKRDYGFSITG